MLLRFQIEKDGSVRRIFEETQAHFKKGLRALGFIENGIPYDFKSRDSKRRMLDILVDTE